MESARVKYMDVKSEDCSVTTTVLKGASGIRQQTALDFVRLDFCKTLNLSFFVKIELPLQSMLYYCFNFITFPIN